MRMIIAIFAFVVLAGCTNPRSSIVIKNLDGWHRASEEYHPMVEVEVDAEGYPSAPKEVIDTFRASSVLRKRWKEKFQNNPNAPPELFSDEDRFAILNEHGIGNTVELQRIRWKIHPNAPLKRVAWMTGTLTETERSEFWTSYGIFIVGGPNYGGRRLPLLGKAADYRVVENTVLKNGEAWREADFFVGASKRILVDLDAQTDLGLVNLYFSFPDSATWKDAENVVSNVLGELDGLRGLWLGIDAKGNVTLHFHDVWKEKWKSAKNNGKTSKETQIDGVEFEI